MDNNRNSQLRLAGIHEAGHVVMRHHHGLITPTVVIWPDGTGMTAPDGGIIESLEVRLDVALGGQIAESQAGGPDVTPTRELVDALIGDIEFGVDAEDLWGDYYQAVVTARGQRPHWTKADVTAALSASHERGRGALRERWTVVGRLADALVASVGVGLDQGEIEAIFEQE